MFVLGTPVGFGKPLNFGWLKMATLLATNTFFSGKEVPSKTRTVCYTWRIIPVSKWLENPIYKPFRPFGRGPAILGDVTNHSYQPLTNWDDPPSTGYGH